MTHALTDAELQTALTSIPDWSIDGNCLERSFVFKDFNEALGFIVRVGLHAEKQNHHPELINVYNKLTVRLSTHDAGNRVTIKDVTLAKSIEELWQEGRSK